MIQKFSRNELTYLDGGGDNVLANKIELMIDYIEDKFNELTNPEITWELEDGAREPSKAHPSDAGFDIYAYENVVIRPGETVKIKTGVRAEPSPGYFFLIRDRSSVGSKGIIVSGGIVDNAYRGEILVCLCNTNQGGEDYTYLINKGDKIAQLILLPSYEVETKVGKVSSSDRGEKGFGSSGK